MIDFKNKINKQAKSYEIACKCARTTNIYDERVLQANKFNLNFLHHLRSLELDICKEEALHSIVCAGDIAPCTIKLINTNRQDVLRVIANADLSSAFEALDCANYYLRNTMNLNGEITNVYEVRFNLTL